MERRRTPRFAADGGVTVILLGDSPVELKGQIVEASAGGLRVLLPAAAKPDQCLQIETGEFTLFGEVCYCEPHSGSLVLPFAAGVVVQQCLSGLDSIRHLIAALHPERERVPAKEAR